MIKKLTLGLGFGAGYVLGAKAGTQRYDQIVAKVRELAGMPAVQEVTDNLSATASTLADAAKTKANDTISSVAATASSTPETVDLTTGGTTAAPAGRTGSTGTGYETGAAGPMAGAAASDTV